MGSTDSILSDLQPREEEANYGIRVMANLIDLVMEIILLISVYFLAKKANIELFRSNSLMVYVFVIAITIFYRIICMLLFEKTIGMMILKTKYLNVKLEPLSGSEKLIAAIVVRTSGIKIFRQK